MVNKLKKNKWIINLVFSTKWKDKKRLIKTWTKGKQYYFVEDANTDMKELLKCTLCPNMCRFECPVLRVTQKETFSPATKARIAYYMERGNLPMSNMDNAEVAYMCNNCNGCQAWCPMDISTGDLLKGVRADLVKKDIFIPGIKEFNDRLMSERTAFKKDSFIKNPEFKIEMENPEVFYFIGCVMAEKKPEAVIANINILKKAGISFTTGIETRECCGGPLNTLGFLESVKSFAKHNIEEITKQGTTTIVTDCPSCAFTIKDVYPELGFDHVFEVLTTTQYFKKLIELGKLNPIRPVNETITYHDPCYSARLLDKRDTLLNDPTNINKKQYLSDAREIFKKIPGLELKEVFLHGKETQCCGRGGVMHVHHSDVSDKIGIQRLNQLNKMETKYIVSSCPSCEEGLMFVGGSNILDIGEILLKSLD